MILYTSNWLYDMRDFKKRIKSKAPLIISIPALLCFITFITNLVSSLRDGVIDSVEYHHLLTYVDGFETVVLFVIMLVLRDKK